MSDGPAAVPSKPTAMVPGEQRFGYGLAVLALLFAVEVAVRGSLPLGGLALAAAVLLALAVRHGQRIIACFAAIVAAFLVSGFLPLEVLFLGYSGFIMLRVSKEQGKLNAARPRTTPRARRDAKVAKTARKSGATDSGSAVTRQPAANRRYTPPKSKPAPKPPTRAPGPSAGK